MTLLSVWWPLPKASVEYTWVQLAKVLRSALKSGGSPAQQMCGLLVWWGGYQKGNSLNEKKRWNSFKFSSVVGDTLRFLRSRCAPGGSLPCLVHALGCLLPRAYLSAAVHRRFLHKSFCECQSILLCLKLWTVAKQLWQSAQSSTRPPWSKFPPVCGFDKNHWFIISEVKLHQRLQ